MSSTTIQDIKLLDTIGNVCIVKMPKWVFAKIQTFFSPAKKGKEKYNIMMEAYEDAMNSKKVYHSVEELFKDLDSDD